MVTEIHTVKTEEMLEFVSGQLIECASATTNDEKCRKTLIYTCFTKVWMVTLRIFETQEGVSQTKFLCTCHDVGNAVKFYNDADSYDWHSI